MTQIDTFRKFLEPRPKPPLTVEDGRAYIIRALDSFKNDPADTEFQPGFQAALEVVAKEVFGISHDGR